jgi:thiamine-phosphate pyrophosphorylase
VGIKRFLFLPQSASKSEQQDGDKCVPSGAKLYIDFEIAGTPGAAREMLSAVLDAASPVASVLIRPVGDATLDAETMRSLIALAQKMGAAVLLVSDPARASALGADGVHVPLAQDVVQQFKDVRRNAGAGAIIGADAGRTRHDAMELGEADADYVAFGIPPHVEDRARAADRQLNLISWWSEVFEVPCVAFNVADAEHAHRLAEAGADFISVTLTPQDSISDAVARVRAFAQAVTLLEEAK